MCFMYPGIKLVSLEVRRPRRGRKLAVLSWFVKGHSPSFITSMDKSEKKHAQKSTHLIS